MEFNVRPAIFRRGKLPSGFLLAASFIGATSRERARVFFGGVPARSPRSDCKHDVCDIFALVPRSVAYPDGTDHLSHRLKARGVHESNIALTFYVASVLYGIMAVALHRLG
jgi:hypothetical protein